MKLFVAVAIFGAVLAASPASATHDMVYAPCDPEETRSLDEQVWYQDYQSGTALRYDDPWWAERPGLAGYTNWEHQCRLGQTGVWQAAPIPPLVHPPDYEVETRQSKSPCIRELETTVDRLIAEGLLSSEHVTVTDHGVFLNHTSPVLLVETGVVMEWALGNDGYGRHYTDIYWEYRFDGVSNWTFWEINCLPTVPTTTTTTTTSTTLPPEPEPLPESGPDNEMPLPEPTTTTLPAPTTTVPLPPTTTVLESSAVEGPENTIPEDAIALAPPPIVSPDPSPLLVDGYDLFSAQWDGYPFEQTILLLEERYPPGTPDKYHFRLSTAVEYLRQGGMVGGLDAVWNTGN